MTLFVPRRALAPRTPSLPRYFEGLFLLLLATGFATLAVTGRLGWTVALVAGGAYLARGGLFILGREPRLPRRWLATALLLYLPIFALDGLFLSRGFVEATLHFVVLAGAAQLFTSRSGRESLSLGLLALLEVLAAALLTVSGIFFLFFLLFLVLLIATLMAHEMVRSQTGADAASAGDASPQEEVGAIPPWSTPMPRRLLPALLRFSLLLSFGVVACGTAIFFLLPRTTMAGWAARPLTALSGFSDQVQLGEIAQLQRNNRPVMHIRITRADASVTPELFQRIPWRGRGLTYFDGRTWSSPGDAAIYSTDAGRLEVNRPSWQLLPEMVHYQVTLEPVGSPVLFFPPRLLRAATHDSALAWERSTATLSSLGHGFGGVAYAGVSDLAQPSPAELRQSPPPDSERMRAESAPFLQLPEGLDPRIRALAHDIVAHVPADNWDRMQALTEYLQSHYQYTLRNLPQGPDPLAEFLFDQPAGDCEYFASALAVMARALAIPTRVVNGFLLGSYNPISGEYLVRGSDAHTWVEAYFPPSGRLRSGHWISFDATPTAAPSEAGLWPQADMMLDALSSFWQEWIVNYDWIRQANLARSLQQGLHGAVDQGWTSGLTTARDRVSRWSPRASPAGRTGGLVLALLAFVALAAYRLGWLRRQARPPADPGDATSRRVQAAYRRFQRDLRRVGILHPRSQTAPELAAAVAAAYPRSELALAADEFATTYEAARFDHPDPRLALRLRQILRQVRRACRRRPRTN